MEPIGLDIQTRKRIFGAKYRTYHRAIWVWKLEEVAQRTAERLVREWYQILRAKYAKERDDA